MTCIAAGSPPVAPTPWKNSQAAPAATTRAPSSTGMPGRERIGFSFMTGLLVSPIGQVSDSKLISYIQAPVLAGAASAASFWHRHQLERKNVGEGKSVQVRVADVGSHIIKNNRR